MFAHRRRQHRTFGKRRARLVAALAALALIGTGAVATTVPASAAPASVSVTVVLGDADLFAQAERDVVIEVYAADDPSSPVDTVAARHDTSDALAFASIPVELEPGAYRLRAVIDDAHSGWHVDSLPATDDVVFDEFANVGFSAPTTFEEATVVEVAADGTASAGNLLIAVHPEPNSILGGVFSDSDDAFTDAFMPLDVGAVLEVFPVGSPTAVATGETGPTGVALIGGLAPGSYEVRLTGERTVTPETGAAFSETVSQWWPMQTTRSAARTITIPDGGGHWVGITANLATEDFSETQPGERAVIGGEAAVDRTVTLTPSVDLGEGVDPVLLDRLNEYDVHLADIRWFADGDEVPGASGSSLALTPDLEGRMLHAEFTSYVAFGAIRERASTPPVLVGPSPLPALSPAPVPTIAAPPVVGTKLTATVGAWGPGQVTFAYQWSRDGEPIPGAIATSYTPVPDDVGGVLTFAVTASRTGYATALRVSEPTAPVAAGALTAPVPVVKGTLRVGAPPLTVATGTWKPAPVDLAFQWLRDGEVVDGATGATYALSAADVGATIAVRVTGSKPGYTTITQQSAPTTAVVAGRITNSVLPSISGTARVGQQLTASPGAWAPSEVTFAFEWLRAGTPIPGADGVTYTLTPADVGKAIKVRVTASLDGYTSLVKTSAATARVAP